MGKFVSPYNCELCQLGFKTRTALTSHNKSSAHQTKLSMRPLKRKWTVEESTTQASETQDTPEKKAEAIVLEDVEILPSMKEVDVLPSMVANHVYLVQAIEVPSSPELGPSKQTRGAATRMRYSPKKVVETIEAAVKLRAASKAHVSMHALAQKLAVPEANLTRWMKHQERYKAEAARMMRHSTHGLKQRRFASRYMHSQSRRGEFGETITALEAHLREKLEADQRKRFITCPRVEAFAKAFLAARPAVVTRQGVPFEAGHVWCWRFLVREGMVSRRRARKRPSTPEQLAEAMTTWLHFLRQVVTGATPPAVAAASSTDPIPVTYIPAPSTIRNRKRAAMDEHEPLPQEGVTVRDDEWGRFPLKYRFNVDSVPVTLEHLPRRSFFPGEDRTSQVMGAPSEDKRFCTMHVCVHGAPAATMPQPKVAVIFRGKGMRAQARSQGQTFPHH